MTRILSIKIVLYFILSSIVIACYTFKPGGAEYVEITRMKINGKSEEAIRNRISEFPIDSQIDAYLFSIYSVEGSQVDFERLLIQDGEQKLGRLAERIDLAKRADHRYSLLVVVWSIDTKCGCVKSKSEVLALIKKNRMPSKTPTRQYKNTRESYEKMYSRVLDRILESKN